MNYYQLLYLISVMYPEFGMIGSVLDLIYGLKEYKRAFLYMGSQTRKAATLKKTQTHVVSMGNGGDSKSTHE